MAEKTPSTGSTSATASTASLDSWEPIIEWIKGTADKMDKKTRQMVIGGTVGGIVLLSLVLSFVEVPRYVHAILGIPFGLMLFATFVGGTHLYYRAHPNKTPLRETYPPMQRIKIALGLYAIIAIFLLVINTHVPVILGGVLAVSMVLSVYEFMRRSREEIELNESGEMDPRDLEILRKKEEEAKKKKKVDDEEILKILAELPEEKRALLANANLSNAVVVKKKKRGLFGRSN